MWQWVNSLKVFNTLTLKQIFWKTKIFFKKLEYRFELKTLRLKTHHFHTKLPHQKPMIRQIEWWLQNGPIKKNGDLPVTSLFFWKFCFSLRTSYKELVWCAKNTNVHIRTFCKRWSFIWRYFFPVSILKSNSYVILPAILNEHQTTSTVKVKSYPVS